MKTLCLGFWLSLASIVTIYAQREKPPIDFAAIENWQTVGSERISNSGKYFGYTVTNLPAGSSTLFVASVNGYWKFSKMGAGQLAFSNNNRFAFFKCIDTLFILKLGSSDVESVSCSQYSLFMAQGDEWLASLSADHMLTVRNLQTGPKQEFKDVLSFQKSFDGSTLWLTTGNEALQSLSRVCLKHGLYEKTPAVIWKGAAGVTVSNLTFSSKGNLTAFSTEQKSGGFPDSIQRSFWLSKNGAPAKEAVNDKTATFAGLGDNRNVRLSSINRFTADGAKLFITIEEPTPLPALKNSVGVNVWSWHDKELQSAQLAQLDRNNGLRYRGDIQQYAAILSINNKKVMRLQEKSEKEGMSILMHPAVDDQVILLYRPSKESNEDYWLNTVQPVDWLVSTETGLKKLAPVFRPRFMPEDPRYIIGSDTIMSYYFSNNVIVYDRTTGKRFNITNDINEPGDISNDGDGSFFRTKDIHFRWKEKRSQTAIVSNYYDYWRVNFSPDTKPVNITSGFGRAKNIHFHPVQFRTGIYDDLREYVGVVAPGQILYSGFHADTKEIGFYLVDAGKVDTPQLISKGPFSWQNNSKEVRSVLKARDANVFLLKRDSAGQSSNLVVTTDFRKFKQLTFYYPDKTYCLYTKELITYNTLDAKKNYAVLYKPEGFDPSKKYPVIFNYYEERTHRLNDYEQPFLFSDAYDISPWFASRGYVICVPDITVTPGMSGEAAVNAVVGAAEYLEKTFGWTDPRHMGVVGHSYGGYETNYIITHSNKFAAAHTGAGLANLTSMYGDVTVSTGEPRQRALMEVGQTQMGQTMWENPTLYIDRSPIFNVDKVSTPLLMMHNDKDGICNFSDAVQFFTALRRLGKKAWMLQYDNDYHSILNPERQKDYTIRMTQFFDHYLKGAPAPKWMSHGIPASQKGIDDGLNLENSTTQQ